MQFHRRAYFNCLFLIVFIAAPSVAPAAGETRSLLPEAVRETISTLVVVAGTSPTEQAISGDYEKATLGTLGGINAGAQAGSPSAQVGPVNVNFPFPILTIPGALIGGVAGKAQREQQEFRDALAEDLAAAANQPLTNDGLALDVYRELQTRSGLDTRLFAASTPVPDDTDAILYAAIKEVSIDVQDSAAILTTIAEMSLVRKNNDETLFQQQIAYQDRDSLSNWTKDNNALWRDYANFARHYLGRKISAATFLATDLENELSPARSDNIRLQRKNAWQGETRTATPTLAWNFSLAGDDRASPRTGEIDEASVYFDVEVYDNHRLVYSQKRVADNFHRLNYALDDCKSYRWSVRPVYARGRGVRLGRWMRFAAEKGVDTATGIVGDEASAAPAYTRNFARVDVKCGSR